MKKIFIGIISVITVFAIIFGTMYHIGGAFHVFGRWFGDGKTNSESKELDQFDSIYVDSNVAELTIGRGEGYSISIDSSEDIYPEYSVKDSVLTIKQKNNKTVHFNDLDCEVNITIPSGQALDEINITGDVGDIMIKDISSAKTTVLSDVGDINFDSCDIGVINLSSSVGNIQLDDCAFTGADIRTDCGDVDIDSTKNLSGWMIDCETDIGEVNINADDEGDDFSQSGSEGNIVVRGDTGDITINY